LGAAFLITFFVATAFFLSFADAIFHLY
jgi:hypothetical protein